MSTRELDKDVLDRPVVNSWRAAPSARQLRYATDLCRTELPYAQRQAAIASFPALDAQAISALIDDLAAVRDRRMARLRGTRRRRR